MKMEIELTDEQAKKVEILQKSGVSVGEAIDMLFEMNNALLDDKIDSATQRKVELEAELAVLEEEISTFTKIKDSSLDSTQKQKIVEKQYGTVDKTYDEEIQGRKHNFKWSNLF